MNFVKDFLLRVWKPNFLDEDDLGLEVGENVLQVELVSSSAFNVE